ncbi:MAG TPA: serine/threonine-protein kinase [Vicinamibacteria bacterium]|nr:serine/threonine-protein kinase [Vicinamibacteria bacterium]
MLRPDPADWRTLNQLLDEALEVPPQQRAKWIDHLPAELDALKPRLKSLLANLSLDAPFETIPKIDVETERRREPEESGPSRAPAASGETVGPYNLVRLLAEGGMGAVWLAERADGMMQRPVALKLPRGVWSRPELLSRMAREREILASLNHTHIARLYDAGLASDGQPYLAMEYVRGQPIDEYVREKGLDTRGRLRLFLQVAQAVSHAHARLVVHRDLKPSNIMVTEEGEARLLDFGIAKLLEDGEARETEITRLSGRALTLAYASPEQVSGAPLGVASDVYSLGVVLFQLLTGSLPYHPVRDSVGAAEEAVLDAIPPKPSDAAKDAQARKTLRGDLDTVVLKALKKRPEERYPTVDAFADDVTRFLEDRPVKAQADSFLYRFRKLIERNKLAFGAAAAILGAILGGAVLAVWQARVAIAEKERAQEVKEFIASIFRDSDPYGASTGEVPTILDLLKRAREKIDGSLAGRPDLQVELLNLVGSSLLSLQESVIAEEVVGQAVEVGTKALGRNHPQTLQARILMTQVHRFRGRTEEMKKELDTLVPALRSHGGPSESLVIALKQQANLAIDAGNYEEAEAKAKQASDMSLSVLGPGHPETTKTEMLLALSYLYARKPQESLVAADRAYGHALESTGGNDKHPLVIEVRAVRARAIGEAGDPERGAETLSQVVTDTAEVFGDSAMMVGFFSQNLAPLLLDVGDLDSAFEASERARSILSQHAQPESYTFASVRRMRGLSLLLQRKDREALSDLSAAADAYVKVIGPAHDATLSTRAYRALARAYTGSVGDALEELESVVDAVSKGRSTVTSTALRALGTVHRLAGSLEEALRLHEQALGAITEGPRAERERMAVLTEIGLDQVALGQNAEAARSLEEALELFDRLHRKPTPYRADALVGLGRARLGLGRPEEALEPLQQAENLWKGWDSRSSSAKEAAVWRLRCAEALGR